MWRRPSCSLRSPPRPRPPWPRSMAAISPPPCVDRRMTRAAPRWLKPATEYGPLAVFLAVYAWAGLMPATAALLAATGVGLVLSLLLLRRLPLMPLVTAAVVGVLGGLTLWQIGRAHV